MKTIFTTIFSMLITAFLCAQAPQGIPYQAVMRNADGSVMASSSVSLTFMIHDATANGNVVYQESHTLTSNAQGLVSCVVGNGVVSQGNFANINWGGGAKFLQVMMGGTDLGTQQMLSVPYALHSASADNATNAETAANGFSNVSQTGDTLYMANGNFIIVPGISAANYPSQVLGCTNAQACNYNFAATLDDGSCSLQGATCNDGNANTTNDMIDVNCQCLGITGGSGGTGAQLLPGIATCSTQMISVTGCGGQTSLTYDGRTYDLVEIGGQCWFADNLATDQYRNGDLISPNIGSTIGAFTYYDNAIINDSIYGKLYNWYATVDSRGLCPSGWHVPSDCEYMFLESSIGLTPDVLEYATWRSTLGDHLKSTELWFLPNNSDNSSGFTAVPGGYWGGGFLALGQGCIFGTSTEWDGGSAWYRMMSTGNGIARSTGGKGSGYSIRCLKD
jgi:uncharacterized protein (TIGR02145 family)